LYNNLVFDIKVDIKEKKDEEISCNPNNA
jgi:hypothetical protein